MSDGNQIPIKSVGLFSMLETAMEIKFFFLATTFVLWVDNVFLYLHHPGIAELIKNPQLQNISLTLNLVLIFLAFSFASSILLPCFSYLTNQIYVEFIWEKIQKFFGVSSNFSDIPRDYIYAHKLKEIAHLTKDKFLLDTYIAYKKAQSENENIIERLASLALFCLILLSINYFKFEKNNSISQFVLNYLDSPNLIWFCFIGLLLLIFCRFHIEKRDCVYCPSLYREIEKKERQNMTTQAPFSNKLF